jgi:hypothetical protein
VKVFDRQRTSAEAVTTFLDANANMIDEGKLHGRAELER